MSGRDPLEYSEAELRPHAGQALSDHDKAVNSFLKMHGLDQRRLEALYRHRRSILENIVNTTLRSRKNAVANQVQRVTHAAHRVHEMRRMIEQETQVEMDGILARLNAKAKMKKMTLEVRRWFRARALSRRRTSPRVRPLTLHTSISPRSLHPFLFLSLPPPAQNTLSGLKDHLGSIGEFEKSVLRRDMAPSALITVLGAGVNKTEAELGLYGGTLYRERAGLDEPLTVVSNFEMVEFLEEFPQACAAADRLCARPVDTAIPCTAADLRRETAETRMVVNQVSEMTRALRIKDHMIWDLTQRLKAYGGVDSATHEDFTREISEATKRCSSATSELEAMRSQLSELKRENAGLNREHDASRRHTAMLTEQLARMQEATAALRSATEQIASQERG